MVLGMPWYPCWRNTVAADLQLIEHISPVFSVAASLPPGSFDCLGHVFNVGPRFVESEDVLAWSTMKNEVCFQPYQWLTAN